CYRERSNRVPPRRNVRAAVLRVAPRTLRQQERQAPAVNDDRAVLEQYLSAVEAAALLQYALRREHGQREPGLRFRQHVERLPRQRLAGHHPGTDLRLDHRNRNLLREGFRERELEPPVQDRVPKAR